MAKLNLVRNGFTRRADKDFYDDGSWFRAYEYAGLIVTVCKYEDDYFVHIRTWDITDRQFTNEDWNKTAESRLADEFNGVPVVDVEKLKANCEAIAKKMNELDARVATQSIDMSEVMVALEEEIDKAEKLLGNFKAHYNWFYADPRQLKDLVENAHRFNDQIAEAKNLITDLNNDALDLKTMRYYIQRLERCGYVYLPEEGYYASKLREALA